ncbi:NUDIX hydrolase [Staphylococcus equorum]|uniref:NUDIX hydrolase n=1 Tax=Staphylococcus equorum TaxID=246432 RepID=UPI0029824445|nr:NUDIX domain-containing protein [Staphylococcus equorum]MDW5472293.1 NUDIX domain-containing protein [Staphylococcus equorum]
MKFNLIMVINKDMNKLLFCYRNKNPYKDRYNFVGGKIESDENSINAAYRELFEETGITVHEINLIRYIDLNYWLEEVVIEVYYGILKDEIELVPEKNKLYWIDLNQNFYDNDIFAGDGLIGHIITHLEILNK